MSYEPSLIDHAYAVAVSHENALRRRIGFSIRRPAESFEVNEIVSIVQDRFLQSVRSGRFVLRVCEVANAADEVTRNALPFLLGIARRVCQEEVRRAARLRTFQLAVDVPDHRTSRSLTGCGTSVGACTTTDKVEEALASCSDEAQRILRGRFIDGMKYREISEEIACKPGSVSSRIRRAMNEFRVAYRSVDDGFV